MDFVFTYPNKFVRHSAVPADEVTKSFPPYTLPYMVGQGWVVKVASMGFWDFCERLFTFFFWFFFCKSFLQLFDKVMETRNEWLLSLNGLTIGLFYLLVVVTVSIYWHIFPWASFSTPFSRYFSLDCSRRFSRNFSLGIVRTCAIQFC